MFDLDALTVDLKNVDLKNVDLKNEFKVCNRCKGTNTKTLVPKLAKLDPNAKILTLTCVSYCGPGRDHPFVFLNNKPIKADNEDELIDRIKAALAIN